MRQGKAPSRPRHGNKNLFVHRPPEGKDSVIDHSYRRVSRILIQEDSGTSRSTFPPAVFVWATPFLCVFRNSDLSRQRHSGKLWGLVTDSESISFHRKLRIFTGVAVGQHAHSKQRKRSENPIIPADTVERPSKTTGPARQTGGTRKGIPPVLLSIDVVDEEPSTYFVRLLT